MAIAFDFSLNVNPLTFAVNLLAFDIGGANIRPIAIKVVIEGLITKSFMLASISAAKAHLAKL